MVIKNCILLVLISLVISCSAESKLDVNCERMKTNGLSQERFDYVMSWWHEVTKNPKLLSVVGKKDGWIYANQFDVKLDASKIGVSKSDLLIMFHGVDIDYSEFNPDLADSLLVGDGFGYLLIYRLNKDAQFENDLGLELPGKLMSLREDVYLSCQGPR